jgi:hypothetical protein
MQGEYYEENSFEKKRFDGYGVRAAEFKAYPNQD